MVATDTLTRPELLTWMVNPNIGGCVTRVRHFPPNEPQPERCTSAETPHVATRTLSILVAHVIQHPIRRNSAHIVARCGRFLEVDYEPVGAPDPDLIVCIDYAPAFHKAVQALQIARTFNDFDLSRGHDYQAWYQHVMKYARRLIEPLMALRPTREEARFVMEWAGSAAAEYRRVR